MDYFSISIDNKCQQIVNYVDYNGGHICHLQTASGVQPAVVITVSMRY
jgi:hypothetical protein